MFVWSSCFETQLKIVDQQHRQLVKLLNDLYEHCRDGAASKRIIDRTLEQLLDYASFHFRDEEKLMARRGIDERHQSMHRMEHKSFVFEVERMRNHPSPDETVREMAEKLENFVTSWLTYHILGMDQLMAAQCKAIDDGTDPARAFEEHQVILFDAATTKRLMQSVLTMWRESTKTCYKLQDQLAALRAEQGDG